MAGCLSRAAVAAPSRATPRCRARVQRARASAEPEQTLVLPGGGLWWLNQRRQQHVQPVYGDQFLLLRTKVGGEGLVKRSAPQPPQPYRRSQAAAPAVRAAPGGASLVPVGSGGVAAWAVVVDTEYTVLEQHQPFAAAPQPNHLCLGMVPVAPAGEAPAGQAPRHRHPRRTQRLRFVCNLCGEENVKETNPHAWQRGSVFARCGGCTAVHKLVDNLKIFHELGGPVFPPRELRSSFLVQEILDRIQERNSNDA